MKYVLSGNLCFDHGRITINFKQYSKLMRGCRDESISLSVAYGQRKIIRLRVNKKIKPL